jgi:predicted HTH transcriptional regulator
MTTNRRTVRSESILALKKVSPRKASDRHRILAALVAAPATCRELERELSLCHQTCSARLSELRRKGQVVQTGHRRDGCAVLRLNEASA